VRQMAKKKAKVQKPKAKKVIEHRFRADKVELKEKEGWRRVKGAINPKYPVTHMEDLVLMEKNV